MVRLLWCELYKLRRTPFVVLVALAACLFPVPATLLALFFLPDTARDHLLARQCLGAAACLWALRAGVLLAGRATGEP